MTIERVVMPYTGNHIGGSHISSFTLGQALQEHFDIPVTVFANDDTDIAREAERRGFTVRRLPERKRPRHNPLYDLARIPARARLLAAEGRNVVVHAHGLGALQSWAPVAKLLRRPLVYHNRALNRAILPNRIPMRMADRVICISEAVRNVMRFLPQERVLLIDNPFGIRMDLDAAAERQAVARELDLSPDNLLVGFAANFAARKRPDFFLDVCQIIARERPDARFILYGRRIDFSIEELRQRAESLGIGHLTRLPGFRSPIESNLLALDIHLIPSLKEPFGRNAVESFLLGVPYVGTDDAGIGEIGRRWGGGRLMPVEASAEEFARAALDVLAAPDSVRLSAARRRDIAEELSPRGHAAKVVQVYRELTAGR